jgi:hypothetical protein
VRWQRLFDDLEAQLTAADSAELGAEVSERTRIERGQITLVDRLMACAGRPLTVQLRDGDRLTGTLVEAAPEWLLLGERQVTLVPLAAVGSVSGLGTPATTVGRDRVARRLGLAWALRALATDRSPVRLRVVGGDTLTGTVDAVAADHLDLAEHPADEPRRAQVVRGVRAVPFAAIVSVQPAAGTTSLG